MKIRSIVAALCLLAGTALAASTIDTSKPVTGSALSSSVIRASFAAAATDIAALQTSVTNASANALQKSGNLSDLVNAATARANLGLATVASSASAADLSTGVLLAARMPALTGGDCTSTVSTVSVTCVVTGMTGTLSVSHGGTNCTSASGTCLDNISGLAAIGIQTRTASGTYAVQNGGVAEWGGTAGGSANAQTVSVVPAVTAYVAGMRVVFVAVGTNTSTTTINVDSIGTKNVFSNGVALTGGEILSGKVYEIVYDGTQFNLTSPVNSGHGMLIGVQAFTAAGTSTYTPTAGTQSVEVECVGGGGGGGGAALTGAAQHAIGGAGGGGGYVKKRITSAFSGVTVTVGAKGTGGTAGANNGVDGGTSSFGALAQATGGVKGNGAAAAAAPTATTTGNGGVGSSGDVNAGGQPGQLQINNSTAAVWNGNGGASIWGSGARGFGTATGSAGGSSSQGYGGGGSGGENAASQAAGLAGGDGTAGACFVHEFN